MFRTFPRAVAVAVLGWGLCALAGRAAAAGPSPTTAPAEAEPTADETYLLELMNRMRADPAGEGDRLAPGLADSGPLRWMRVDAEMFKREMKELKPAPPLVFSPALLAAARNHCRYMIANTMTHVEQADKEGFTGASFKNRCKAAGYDGRPIGENVGRDLMGTTAHACFVVDNGPGPGGMQTGRGHRVNMMRPQSREIGLGVVPHSHTFGDGRRARTWTALAVTHEFGSSKVTRWVGGVVYRDANGDRFYTPGEGIGGAKIIASDGSATQTWASGAYALALKSADAATVRMEWTGRSLAVPVPAGKENVKADWILTAAAAPAARPPTPAATGGPGPAVAQPRTTTQPAPDTEKLAAEELAAAKMYLGLSARMKQIGRQKLARIIHDWPDTRAAAEARRLLGSP